LADGHSAVTTAAPPQATNAATHGVRATAASLEPSLPAPFTPRPEPKTCAICRKPALYYFTPTQGRCSAHRLTPTAEVRELLRAWDGRSAAKGAECDMFDRHSKVAASRRGFRSCRLGQR